VRENGRTEVWKRHMKKVMNEEHKWDRKVKADERQSATQSALRDSQ
jgi:hypothetical protein